MALSACATGGAAHNPIIDGPQDAAYQQDLAECRSFAEQRSYDNADVRTQGAYRGWDWWLIGPSECI